MMLRTLLASAALCGLATGAFAAPVTINFDLDVTLDNPVGFDFTSTTGTAALTYDTDDLDGTFSGTFEAIPSVPIIPGAMANPNFDFSISMFGQTFTDAADANSILTIAGGIPTEWAFSISELELANSSFFDDDRVLGFSSIGFVIPNFGLGVDGTVNVVVNDQAAAAGVVPLPATAPLLGAALIGGAVVLRRRSKAS